MVAQVNNDANTGTIGDFNTSLLIIREQVKGYIFSKETGDLNNTKKTQIYLIGMDRTLYPTTYTHN